MDRVSFWVGRYVKRKMVDQVYGEAWLTSMIKVLCQDQETRARVRIRFLENCMGRVLVRLDGGSFSKVRATVQLSRRITVRKV